MRYALYLRVSGADKQDETISLPRQEETCRKSVADAGGDVAAVFRDVASGVRSDRPGWSELVREARDRETRRFDGLCIYGTSRLSRDQLDAILFERELRRHQVLLRYATGGATDPASPEGQLMLSIEQGINAWERAKLQRETKRGLQETTKQGNWPGGRPPFGYRLERIEHPVASRARAGDHKSRLVVDPAQAGHVAWIFDRFAVAEWGTLQIAEDLNKRGIPKPAHTDKSRNIRKAWSKSTVRAILQNPSYTGLVHWGKVDYNPEATEENPKRKPRRRPSSEWTRSEVEHEPLVSEEVFALAQARFRQKRPRNALPRKEQSRKAQSRRKRRHNTPFLLSGHVKCSSGHQPLAMFGSRVKHYHYFRCDFGRQHGRDAADAIPGHGQWCSVREDLLLGFVYSFFEQRVFGAARLDLLAKQLRANEKQSHAKAREAQTRLRRRAKELDSALAAQVRGLEAGVDAALVQARIEELRTESAEVQSQLQEAAPDVLDGHDELAEALAKLPDLSQQLRDAPTETKRQVFDAFALRVEYDRVAGAVSVSATVTEQVAEVFGAISQLGPETGCTLGHGPCRNRTCNLGLKRPLLCRLS